ncbi:peptidase S8/S53 domain-containing protein [Blastocladiella britannica]|nr:peptidase S8/S53 domain-containing protein [Blastocladiella britannica]
MVKIMTPKYQPPRSTAGQRWKPLLFFAALLSIATRTAANEHHDHGQHPPRQWVVHLDPESSPDPDAIAARDGFANHGPLGAAFPNYYIFEAADDIPGHPNAQSLANNMDDGDSTNVNDGSGKGIQRRSVEEIHARFRRDAGYEAYIHQERHERVRRITQLSEKGERVIGGSQPIPGGVFADAIELGDLIPPPPLDSDVSIIVGSDALSGIRRDPNGIIPASLGGRSAVLRAPIDEEAYQVYRTYNDPLWPGAWQINTPVHSTNVSLNVFPMWKAGYTGKGVNVAVIDDGIQGDHPDLISRFNGNFSLNVLDKSTNAQPQVEEDNHGTRCAGEIVAEANNGICSVGIAHGARVTAIKVIGDKHPTDAEEALAFNHRLEDHAIYSSSWGPRDDGATMEGPGPLAVGALAHGVETGRGGRGAVYIFAAGNGGHHDDHCGYDGYASSPYTIAVGSLTAGGTLPYYGESCSAHLVMGLGGAGKGGPLVATTDIHAGCTSGHTGTSAAAPQVAALVALILEARPDLGWRDVQHLLVRSTVVNDRIAPDWAPNRAGYMVHPQYAFGLIDGARLLQNAKKWTRVPTPQLATTFGPSTDGWHIPIAKLDDTATGAEPNTLAAPPLVVTQAVPRSKVGGMRHIELVLVTITLKHPRRGALEVTLVAPEGRSRSVLAAPRSHDASTAGIRSWTFTTVRHWDEDPVGTWSLEIRDVRPAMDVARLNAGGGVLDSWMLEFRGRCAAEDTVPLANGASTCRSEAKGSPLPSSSSSSSSSVAQNVVERAMTLSPLTVLAIGMLAAAAAFIGARMVRKAGLLATARGVIRRRLGFRNLGSSSASIVAGGGTSTESLVAAPRGVEEGKGRRVSLASLASVRLNAVAAASAAAGGSPNSASSPSSWTLSGGAPERSRSHTYSPSTASLTSVGGGGRLKIMTSRGVSLGRIDPRSMSASSSESSPLQPLLRVGGTRRYNNNDPSASPYDLAAAPPTPALLKGNNPTPVAAAAPPLLSTIDASPTASDQDIHTSLAHVSGVPDSSSPPRAGSRKTQSAANVFTRIASMPRFEGGGQKGRHEQ